MKSYELILILRGDVEKPVFEQEITKTRDLIEANGGTIAGVDDWGRREIAYEFSKCKHGHYVNIRFDTEASDTVEKLTSMLRISEPVLKFQAHRVDSSDRGFKGNPLLLKKKGGSSREYARD